MEKRLEKIENEIHHYDDGKKIKGAHSNLTGDNSKLYGNCSWIYGDCSGLEGDCSWIYGDVTGIYGDCTRLRGHLSECDISDEDRAAGIELDDLVK